MLNKGRQDGARLLSSTTGNEAASSVIAQNYGGLEKIHPFTGLSNNSPSIIHRLHCKSESVVYCTKDSQNICCPPAPTLKKSNSLTLPQPPLPLFATAGATLTPETFVLFPKNFFYFPMFPQCFVFNVFVLFSRFFVVMTLVIIPLRW